MFKFCVVFAIAVSGISATSEHKEEPVVHEPFADNSFYYEHFDKNSIGDHGSHDSGKGAHGAELSSLAHTSAVQANTAVQNQHTAGSQAAFGIKSSLASAAYGNAQAAQAALVSKKALVNNLRQQLAEAQQQVHGEVAQYQQTQAAAQAAEDTAHQAQNQLSSLSAAAAAAQSGAQRAAQAATEAAQAAASQHAMLVDAKQRLEQLSAQLQNSLGDLQQTQDAAQRAAESAHLARSNAAAAGAAVAAHGSKGYQHNYHY